MTQSTISEYNTKTEFFDRGNERLVTEVFKKQTKKLDLDIHYRHNMIPFSLLLKYATDERDEVENRCKGEYSRRGEPCSNYGSCWGCPPHSPSLNKYNKDDWKHVLVWCMWIMWDQVSEQIDSNNRYFYLMNSDRTLSPMMWKYGRKLERTLGGKMMCSGRCQVCKKCRAEQNEPCLHPNKRRSSLEALGINVVELSREVLDHEIDWYRSWQGEIETPEYITQVYGILTDNKEPKQKV